MARRAHRTDANQSEIVDVLRKAGATVTPTHMVGDGFVDAVAGYQGINYLLEIKDGDKPPSARKLTEPEIRWHEEWRGQVAIVNSPQEALEVIGVKFK